MKSKLIKDLNVKAKIEKCPEDDLGANLDLRVGKDCLENKKHKLLEIADKFIILKLKIAFQKPLRK